MYRPDFLSAEQERALVQDIQRIEVENVEMHGGIVRRTRAKTLEQIRLPRSAYVIQGAARWLWQHHIPPTEQLRYSITYRTWRPR